MEKLTSVEIRKKFLDFFEKRNHLKIQSSSIIPVNDPTLLFINAGMAPLKKYFLGKEEPSSKCLVNFQPCIRTKDIDDVGDRHHLTFFEMLGSWSIGDYYKERAVELAYELLVDVLKFDRNKLYCTVYEGNPDLGLPADVESEAAWIKMGIAPDHVIRLGEDNFWAAGETGPCGPCTEVFYDCGEQFGPAYKPGEEFDTTKRYIEIWNAGVYMELDRQKDGSYRPLPIKSVDTGSGLERMAMVMGGLESCYETDLFKPLMDLNKKLFSTDETTTRMLSDHLRSACFIISEGISPSNEGQGYIPRRLLRKCLAALVRAKVKKIDLNPIIEQVIVTLGDVYPNLKSNKDFIVHQVNQETNEFLPIVKQGIERIEEASSDLKSTIFPGKIAFELVTTFGLPLEVLKADLAERKLTLDETEYNRCYEEHKKVSRVIKKQAGVTSDVETLEEMVHAVPATKFLGYDQLELDEELTYVFKEGRRVDRVESGETFYVATERTPFYAESGGQVGDTGIIQASSGRASVLDTMKIGKVHLHVARVEEGSLERGKNAKLIVDQPRRRKIAANHSATHLLHSALREVVGKHALQKGSRVDEKSLRFDFQHDSAISRTDLDRIEQLVNGWAQANTGREVQELDYREAIDKGAIALFGESYAAKVRMVAFGEDSIELCGGTHTNATGDIGLFVIGSESSVSRGVRRIEAYTGMAAVNIVQERNRTLKEAAQLLGAGTQNLVEKIELLKKKSAEQKKAKKSTAPKLGDASFADERQFKVGSLNCFIGRTDSDRDTIKTLGDQLIDKKENQIVTLMGVEEDAVRVFVWVAKEYTKMVKAGDLIKEVLAPIDGKGGGRPNFAQGGGPNVEKVSHIFQLVDNGTLKDWIEKRL